MKYRAPFQASKLLSKIQLLLGVPGLDEEIIGTTNAKRLGTTPDI